MNYKQTLRVLSLSLALISAAAEAQESQSLATLPLSEFLDHVSGEYRLSRGQALGCPSDVVVTHPSGVGSETIAFASMVREPGMRGWIQGIDGPAESGGPHHDEIIETRVRRSGVRIISERRECRDRFLWGLHCGRWTESRLAPTVIFTADGREMTISKPDVRWFYPSVVPGPLYCRFERVR